MPATEDMELPSKVAPKALYRNNVKKKNPHPNKNVSKSKLDVLL